MKSSVFTRNPGYHVICFNGTQPRQGQVSIIDCNVSNNPGQYNIRGSSTGGAIACANSTTQIDHCIIKGNRALVMTPQVIGGGNAGLVFVESDVSLNDTLIEGNEALNAAAICVLSGSKVEMNRGAIQGNHAQSVLFAGKNIGGEGSGIVIDESSEVTMNGVTLEGNIADGEVGAISNAGELNLNAGTVITKNTAKRYSVLENLASGTININKDVRIHSNIDAQRPFRPIHSEGVLNMDPS